MTSDDILFNEKISKSGLIGEVILNRPNALNALTYDMCKNFSEQLKRWESNDDIHAVIVKGAGDRAFCAGGDVRKLYENRDKNLNVIRDFFWQEYRLDTLVHHFSKPYFSLLHHITMGGGAGISIHGRYRIATENLMFAMPETKIGFYPDIGAAHFLNQCPNYTGLYLGLTGNTIDAMTAHALGLVTHIIPENKIPEFEAMLYKTETITKELIDTFSIKKNDFELKPHVEIIEYCFSANSVGEIIKRLQQKNDWANTIAKQLKTRCPTSLKITFEAYHRAKKMKFDDIMQMDFDLCQQFLIQPDFFEGVRAALIDKDQSPHWQPEISDKEMERYFEFKGKPLF